MTVHFTHPYLLDPQHKITVNLVGLGGTGSQALTCLARMNEALIALGHAGLHVKCWDDDIVTDSNIGRQLFSPADLGQNKAVVSVTRVNRFFGYDWEGHPEQFCAQPNTGANILITCVDSAEGRLHIGDVVRGQKNPGNEPHNKRIYWLDFGNLQHTGQVILGTLKKVKQPESKHVTKDQLQTVVEKFNLKKIKEEQQGPSCSVAQALNRQDLFINSTLAQLGINLLWKLFREGMISYHGCYVNLKSFVVNPIKI